VRDRILKILAEGPNRNSVLQKRGKFTPSALYLHLKKLRESGVLERRQMGRQVELSLKAHGAPKPPLEGEIIGEPAPVI
jgi:DNA-binding transcriptional ArsR family regulator